MFSTGDAVIVVTTGDRVRVLHSPQAVMDHATPEAQASSGVSPT